MKKIMLLIVLSIATIGAQAQDKSSDFNGDILVLKSFLNDQDSRSDCEIAFDALLEGTKKHGAVTVLRLYASELKMNGSVYADIDESLEKQGKALKNNFKKKCMIP